jgi:hypothetical protein
MKKLWLGLLFAPALVVAQPCFGPGGCDLSCPVGQYYDDCNHTSAGPAPCVPGCKAIADSPDEGNGPFGPGELCIKDACSPVTYFWVGAKAVASSWLPNGYEVLGWAGPCLNEDVSKCPDIFNQAFADLRTNALRANRAQGYHP